MKKSNAYDEGLEITNVGLIWLNQSLTFDMFL